MASHPEESTEPVPDSYLETVEYHNRTYQRYAITNDAYHAPIDEDEEERLYIVHNVCKILFNGRFVFPPLNSVRRVLDCGYGCAAWAVDVAEQYPRAEVGNPKYIGNREAGFIIGVDINPSMRPDVIPENVYLQLDDLNRSFSFSANYFDLVNSQMMASSIDTNKWRRYTRELHRVTRPRGWAQMTEIYFNVQSDSGLLTPDHALSQWSSLYFESLEDSKDLRAPLRLEELMKDAGFVDVENRNLQLHACGWSNDPKEYEVGVANRENVQRFLASLATYPLTEKLGISIQEVQLLIARARMEADDPALKVYFPLYVCIGRKSRSSRR